MPENVENEKPDQELDLSLDSVNEEFADVAKKFVKMKGAVLGRKLLQAICEFGIEELNKYEQNLKNELFEEEPNEGEDNEHCNKLDGCECSEDFSNGN